LRELLKNLVPQKKPPRKVHTTNKDNSISSDSLVITAKEEEKREGRGRESE
jgi:hypothetical protein